jgi:hypothetical protein
MTFSIMADSIRTFSKMTFSIMAIYTAKKLCVVLSGLSFMLSIVMLSVMLNVVMLSVIMLNVVMLSIIMLYVIMLSVT